MSIYKDVYFHYYTEEEQNKNFAAVEWWKWMDSVLKQHFKHINKSKKCWTVFVEIAQRFEQERGRHDGNDDPDLCRFTSILFSGLINRYNPQEDEEFLKLLVEDMLTSEFDSSVRDFYEHEVVMSFINSLNISEKIQFEVFNECLRHKRSIDTDALYFRTEPLSLLASFGPAIDNNVIYESEEKGFVTDVVPALIELMPEKFKPEFMQTLMKRGWVSNSEYLISQIK